MKDIMIPNIFMFYKREPITNRFKTGFQFNMWLIRMNYVYYFNQGGYGKDEMVAKETISQECA